MWVLNNIYLEKFELIAVGVWIRRFTQHHNESIWYWFDNIIPGNNSEASVAMVTYLLKEDISIYDYKLKSLKWLRDLG